MTRPLDPFIRPEHSLEVRLRRIEEAVRRGNVGVGPPAPKPVIEQSTDGFLSMTTTPDVAAGPFTIPNPGILVIAFMWSEWTSFWNTGTSDHNIANEISMDDGGSWDSRTNPGRRTGSSEAGENYDAATFLHAVIGTPTGDDIHFRTRAYTTVDTGADDIRWPEHIYGYIPL